jgi:hypothetical protein
VQSKERITMASIAFVETGAEMKVSNESVEEKSEDQRLRLEAVEWKIFRRMKRERRLEGEVKRVRLGSVAGLSTEKSAEAVPSSSIDFDELRSGFRETIGSASENLRTEISALKSSQQRSRMESKRITLISIRVSADSPDLLIVSCIWIVDDKLSQETFIGD